MPVLPHDVGAHRDVSGQFSVLDFADAPAAGTAVYPERFTSDIYLEKRSDVQHYSTMYDHLQARALHPDGTRRFISGAARNLLASTSLPHCRPGARSGSGCRCRRRGAGGW
ncbi:Scr1 family TA system antitoxin-like transcriptional regulator [Streptomyces sp. NPDC054854]